MSSEALSARRALVICSEELAEVPDEQVLGAVAEIRRGGEG